MAPEEAESARPGPVGGAGDIGRVVGQTGDAAEPGRAGGPDDGPALSPAAAAHRLGVAVGTLRSWDRRYGIGPRGHASGAHRRYSPADLAGLEQMCRMVAEGVPVAEAARTLRARIEHPAVTHSAESGSDGPAMRRGADGGAGGGGGGGGGSLPIGRGAGSARGLARAAVRLDTVQVLALLESCLARDGVISAWADTITPALAAVGRKWTETNGRYVEVEHLISWCTTVALHRVRAAPPQARQVPDRGVALACAPDEWHSLPLDVLTAALGEAGVPVRMFGAAVPARALLEAVDRVRPRGVLVWSQTPRTADRALLAALAGRPGTKVLAAGPGWHGPLPDSVAYVESLEKAVSVCVG